MMREINETVSYYEKLKCYCVFYEGDDLILRAKTDEEAIAEGASTIAEMDKFYNNLASEGS